MSANKNNLINIQYLQENLSRYFLDNQEADREEISSIHHHPSSLVYPCSVKEAIYKKLQIILDKTVEKLLVNTQIPALPQ